MPDGTPTFNYGWTKPFVGASDDLWGVELNADLDGIDGVVKRIDNTTAGLAANFSSTPPQMNGTAAPGSASTFARSDHIHPSDTTRLGVIGTATNDNAPTGGVGEYSTASNLTGVSLVSNIDKTVTSLSLGPGDWDVDAMIGIQVPSTGATSISGALSLVNDTYPALADFGQFLMSMNGARTNSYYGPVGLYRYSFASTTVVYLIANSSSTGTALGFIRARRIR